MEKTQCLIIGSGPAGYTAAIYTGRANIPTILYEGLQPGGQLTITTDIENFPGYPNGISGSEMMDDLRLQAERFGASLRSGIITKADLSQRPFKVTVDDGTEIEAETVIIATGASAKYLGLEDEKKPSHVAQALTPIPAYFFSSSRPRYLADAPVAMITVSASISVPSSTVTLKGRCERSALVMMPLRRLAPKRSAWRRRSSIISEPLMPLG